MFTSANNRAWTPQQAEDIKFTLYRADFDTTVTGTYVLEPDNVDYIEVSNFTGGTLAVGDPVRFASGTGVVKEFDDINNVVDILKLTGGVIRAKRTPTGNITANVASNIVVGGGTLFNTEAYANAVIYSSNTDTRIGKIVSITDDTTVVLDTVASANITGNAFVLYDEIVNTANANITATAEVINDKLLNLFDTNLLTLDFLATKTEMSFKIRDASSNTISNYRIFN